MTRDPLERLHDRVPAPDGAVVYYPPKPGREREALYAWKRTGVCPACTRRAITGGRCIICGHKPTP